MLDHHDKHFPTLSIDSRFPEEPLDISAEQGYGYFPAYVGLSLKEDNYKITRKLGFGPRSSVWLIE